MKQYISSTLKYNHHFQKHKSHMQLPKPKEVEIIIFLECSTSNIIIYKMEKLQLTRQLRCTVPFSTYTCIYLHTYMQVEALEKAMLLN